MSKAIDNRLRRLQGQLEKLHTSIQEDKDCTEVLPQFLAVKGAVAASLELYVKEAMQECAEVDKAKLEKLIALLTRI